MTYRYLLFDADNTLFDFDASEAKAFREMLRFFGVSYTDELYAIYHEKNAICWAMLERGETTAEELRGLRFAMFLREAGILLGTDPREVSARYEANLGKQSILLPGALDTVRTLSYRYRLILITNGLSNIQKSRFAASALRPYFKSIYISEEIGRKKPERAFFDYVLRAERIADRRECLVIGDSLTADMDGAIASGIDACWIDGGRDLPTDGRAITYRAAEVRDILQFL